MNSPPTEALAQKQKRRNGRIDAAGHANDDFFRPGSVTDWAR
jgi:hypothetical protein